MFHLIIIYKWILYLSFLGSFLIVSVFLIKKLLRNNLNIHIQYMAGLLILVRLLVPVLPQSSFSILNASPIYFNRPPVISVVDKFSYNQCLTKNIDQNTTDHAQAKSDYFYLNPYFLIDGLFLPPYIVQFTFGVWAAGVLLALLYWFLSLWSCLKTMSYCKPISKGRILHILEQCKKDLQLKKSITVLLSTNVKNPAILGFFKPKILLPSSLLEHITDTDLRNILLHELSHCKRKDILTNYALYLLVTLYWFNPLIWLYVKALKKEMELSCDSTALSHIEPSKAKEYGYTMLKLLEYSNNVRKTNFKMAVGMSVNTADITRRLYLIKKFKKSSPRVLLISMTFVFILSLLLLTDAKANTVFSQNYSSRDKQVLSNYIVDEFGINRIIDNTDFSYEFDPDIIGTWHCVDLVDHISDFKKDKRCWKWTLFFNELQFSQNGIINHNFLTWTKGLIISKENKLSSPYFIKSISGETYLFFQWKNGDYAYGGRIPRYYVFKKVPKVNTSPSLR